MNELPNSLNISSNFHLLLFLVNNLDIKQHFSIIAVMYNKLFKNLYVYNSK